MTREDELYLEDSGENIQGQIWNITRSRRDRVIFQIWPRMFSINSNEDIPKYVLSSLRDSTYEGISELLLARIF